MPTSQEFPFTLEHNLFGPHQRGQYACSAIVLPKKKIAYVPIPKNACTSIKIFLYERRIKRKFAGPFNEIHRKFSHRAIDFARFTADKEHFKFVVVRNPLERFVSAFNNRVIYYGELSEAWIKRNRPGEMRLFKKNRLMFDPDINDFIRRMETYVKASLQIRHHFIPQSMFFHATPEIFDKVYNVRDLAILENDLSDRLGAEVKFPKVQETAGLKSGVKLEDVDPANLQFLKTYYALDFESLKSYL